MSQKSALPSGRLYKHTTIPSPRYVPRHHDISQCQWQSDNLVQKWDDDVCVRESRGCRIVVYAIQAQFLRR
jgi:hypothetical protein